MQKENMCLIKLLKKVGISVFSDRNRRNMNSQRTRQWGYVVTIESKKRIANGYSKYLIPTNDTEKPKLLFFWGKYHQQTIITADIPYIPPLTTVVDL